MSGKGNSGRRPPDSVVIFAPHPDDETLGCAGVIMRAKRAGGRVRVVFLTNGDGFPKAAAMLSGKDMAVLAAEDFLAVARERQQGALDAARVLGLAPDDLVFLSYPDTGLARMPTAAGAAPFTQEFTRKNRTYALVVPDYHTRMHGAPAPYARAAAVGDMAEILRSSRPREIYVTDGADGHTDHGAGFELAREAAAAAGFRGELFTYLIHAAGGTWPWPRGATPEAPFEAHVENGKQVPSDPPWPPGSRRATSREECAAKLAAIRAYTLEMRLAAHYIESFVKSEEIFWRRTWQEEEDGEKIIREIPCSRRRRHCRASAKKREMGRRVREDVSR